MTSTIGTAGGTVTASAGTGSFSEVVAAGQLPASTSVTLGYIAQSSLPAPLYRTAHLANGRLAPQFTQGAGNTYVIAFCTSFGTAPSSGVSLTGTGVVPSSIAVGTQLNIAINQGGTYVDVGTAQVSATGNFSSTPPTVALPGITKSGTYLVYVPASGTNTSQINLGFALAGDDGTGNISDGLQFFQIENSSGAAIPTPTSTFFPISGLDLDGQSLTPDASQGAVVDGSSQVYFFSGLAQHTFTLAPQTLNVSSPVNYGGDGDSIASLPGGDEVVVTADNGFAFPIISGILSGAPVIADTIPNTNGRDGLVISTDGKVLLSRGNSVGTPGIDVYAVTQGAAHTGSTGTGKTSFTFSLIKTFPSGAAGQIVSPFGEDGRDGMAISPADSSRGVVVGYDVNFTATVQLLTGLTGSSPTFASLPLHLPAVRHRAPAGFQRPEPSAHRRPFALTPNGANDVYGVSITPDGTTAYVATDAGILTVSGVNTGTLTQVGSLYSPSITANGTSCPIGRYGSPYSLGILPDGKYLVVDYQCEGLAGGSTDTTQSYGVLLTIPIGSGNVLGAPAGQLNQVVVPTNDQLIVH